jgi:hypothetical protein
MERESTVAGARCAPDSASPSQDESDLEKVCKSVSEPSSREDVGQQPKLQGAIRKDQQEETEMVPLAVEVHQALSTATGIPTPQTDQEKKMPYCELSATPHGELL